MPDGFRPVAHRCACPKLICSRKKQSAKANGDRKLHRNSIPTGVKIVFTVFTAMGVLGATGRSLCAQDLDCTALRFNGSALLIGTQKGCRKYFRRLSFCGLSTNCPRRVNRTADTRQKTQGHQVIWSDKIVSKQPLHTDSAFTK